MSSDVAIDVTASAINVTIPEELREPRRRTVTRSELKFGLDVPAHRHGTAAAPPARTGAPYWMEG